MLGERHDQLEYSALGRRQKIEGGVVGRQQRASDGQAEAGAALTASRGEEGLEDAARVGRRNAWTIVRQA